MLDRDLMIGALTADGMFPATLSKFEADQLSDDELYRLFLELERKEKGGDDIFGEQKSRSGRFATFVWIGSSIYLFMSSPDASLFTWQAALFVFVGMFFAAIVFGWLGYGVQRLVARLLSRGRSELPAGAAATGIKVLGLVIMVVEASLIFFVAREIFRHL